MLNPHIKTLSREAGPISFVSEVCLRDKEILRREAVKRRVDKEEASCEQELAKK